MSVNGENVVKLRVLDKLKKKEKEAAVKEQSLSEGEVEERQEWSSGIDFFLSALGYAGEFKFSISCFKFAVISTININLSRCRKCVEVSIFGLQERRRCLLGSLLYFHVDYWYTNGLLGVRCRSVHIKGPFVQLENDSHIKR